MNRAVVGLALLSLSACSPMGMLEHAVDNETPPPIENKVGSKGELISPKCKYWKASPNQNYSNDRPGNIGCAYVTNLGLMLEDPRDLVRGASGGHIVPDANRSADAIQNYRNGVSAPSSANSAGDAAVDSAVSASTPPTPQ